MWWGNWNTGILKLTTAEHTHSGKARSQTQVSAPSSCPSAPHGGLFSSMKSLGSVLTLIITIQRVDLCYHNLLKRGGARVLAERGGLQWESVPLSILWRSWQGYVGTPQIFTELGHLKYLLNKEERSLHVIKMVTFFTWWSLERSGLNVFLSQKNLPTQVQEWGLQTEFLFMS